MIAIRGVCRVHRDSVGLIFYKLDGQGIAGVAVTLALKHKLYVSQLGCELPCSYNIN